MRLPSEFIRLPLAFDAQRLLHEAYQFSEYEWDYHPLRYDGNTALSLVSLEGGLSNSTIGVMDATEALRGSTYVQQVMQSFGTVIGRSRFMRLAPGKNVPPHADTEFAWRNHVRIHIPIVTHAEIMFSSISESGNDTIDVNMRAGEAWIFDNWREHAVYNNSDVRRIHLVIDTVGSDEFWDLSRRGWDPREPIGNWEQSIRAIEFQADLDVKLSFETSNCPTVRAPTEIEGICAELMKELDHLKLRAPLTYQELQNDFDGFCKGWQAHWALYADDFLQVPYYRSLVDSLKISLRPKLGNIALSSNRVAAYDVAAKWLDATIDASVPGLAKTSEVVKIETISTTYFEQPLFIVAAPRSGATVLFEALCSNNEIWSVGDEGHREIEAIPKLCPDSRNFDTNALSKYDASDSVRKVIEAGYLSRLCNVNRILFTEMRDEARPATVRFLDKTQKNALRIPFLKALYPQARFLFVVREPNASIASIIEAWESQRFVTYPNLPEWTGVNSVDLNWSFPLIDGWRTQVNKSLPEIAAFQWAQTNQRIIRDLGALSKDDYTVLDFQSILTEPSTSLKRACEFAGIPFGPRMQSLAVQGFANSKYMLSKPRLDKWRRYESEISDTSATFEKVQQAILSLRVEN